MPQPPEQEPPKDSNENPSAAAAAVPPVPVETAVKDDGVTLGWRDHRRIVEDLSDSLAKNWRFKWQVCGVVIVLCGTLLGFVTLVIGGRLINAGIAVAENRLADRITELSGKVEAGLRVVDAQVDSVRQRVEERITKEFEQSQIRSTVQEVAESAAARIIAEQLRPAEATVTARLQNFEKFLDERKTQYDADLASFRSELDTLKKRNELTRLADRAVGDGSLGEYERLLRMTREESDPDLRAAGEAETFRVVSAYGPLSPSRVTGTSLNVVALNPAKKEEAELTGDELLIALKSGDPYGRARAALLLKSRPTTFHIVQAVKEALEGERHLEALRYEKAAFAQLTGFKAGRGALDASEELKWWPENAERLRKELAK